MLEKDLEVYDVWESPNENLFIKMCDEYSIAIGRKGQHKPFGSEELRQTQYVKCSNIVSVKKVGKIVFDDQDILTKNITIISNEKNYWTSSY